MTKIDNAVLVQIIILGFGGFIIDLFKLLGVYLNQIWVGHRLISRCVVREVLRLDFSVLEQLIELLIALLNVAKIFHDLLLRLEHITCVTRQYCRLLRRLKSVLDISIGCFLDLLSGQINILERLVCNVDLARFSRRDRPDTRESVWLGSLGAAKAEWCQSGGGLERRCWQLALWVVKEIIEGESAVRGANWKVIE